MITYNRDKDFERYCRNNAIEWTENINNGVLRGLLNREDWFEKWEDSTWGKRGDDYEAFKQALDDAGIEIPFPQRTVWMRQEGS